MGIAGLARRLEPYASRLTPQQLDGYHALVDGPSLAYHAHKLALAAVGSPSRLPSYADINAQAIRWLKALEEVNIKVSAILFDGSLPLTKRAERSSRLAKNNQQVRQFRINYPSAACPIPTQLGSVPYSLLAPSLREALSDTDYDTITRIVPGEADDWCASFATDNLPSVIFSNDTDLLLYHYHSKAIVIFFKDVELWPEPKFNGYSPTDMCHTLELTSLATLAYSLTQDPWKSFDTLLKDARKLDVESKDFRDFSRRYTENPDASGLASRGNLLQCIPQFLDVRISEFVHQARYDTLVPSIYLPLLVEDPNQASAWNVGQGFRLLAYSLLGSEGQAVHHLHTSPSSPTCQAVQEYKRKAQTITAQNIGLHQHADVPIAAASLADDLSTWIQWMTARQVTQNLIWPLIAANLVLLELKSPPNVSDLIRVINGDFDNSWGFVHLTARVQAALYSLRFLKQCSAVWLSKHMDCSAEPRQHVDRLHSLFKSMPSIAELFLIPGQVRRTIGDHTLLRELLSSIYAYADIEVPSEHKPSRKLKKQQREAERKKRRKQEEGEPQSFNVFELLDRA